MDLNSNVKSVLIVTTHPVQYIVPWFRYLNQCEGIRLTVWYATIPNQRQQGVGFGQSFQWDVPLLDGYQWEQLENASSRPSLDSFWGTKIKGITQRIRQVAPQLVIVLGWHQFSLVQAAIACKVLKVPCMVRGESNNLRQRSWLKRLIHRAFLKLFCCYLYIGAANRDFYLENGAGREKLYFTPYFVDNQWFQSYLSNKENYRFEWRNNHNIDDAETVFLYVGKLQAKKNLIELMNAFKGLAEKYDDVRLVIVGNGEMAGTLEKLAASVGNKVIFAGFVNQSEMPMQYLASDCLVLTSDFGETWGLVVNEAMNCELPVVISDRVGCGKDLVIGRETGYCYAFGRADALYNALEAVHTSGEKRQALGRNAISHIANYSVEASTDNLLTAIGRFAI